jgi:hypothetical protein
MKSSVPSNLAVAMLFLLALAISFASPVSCQEYSAPGLGTPVRFDSFPDLADLNVKGLDRFAPGRSRILGRARIGEVELVYVWREYPVYPDEEGDSLQPIGYEVDDGSIARVAGGWITPLWASNGDLFSSYPDFNEALLNAVLEDYIQQLVNTFGSKEKLQRHIDIHKSCDLSDVWQNAIFTKFGFSCRE